MINFATLLTQQQVERTHAASLEILENVGLLVRNEKARMIFKQHGCLEETGTQIVKFPPARGREIPGHAATHLHLLRSRPQV